MGRENAPPEMTDDDAPTRIVPPHRAGVMAVTTPMPESPSARPRIARSSWPTWPSLETAVREALLAADHDAKTVKASAPTIPPGIPSPLGDVQPKTQTQRMPDAPSRTRISSLPPVTMNAVPITPPIWSRRDVITVKSVRPAIHRSWVERMTRAQVVVALAIVAMLGALAGAGFASRHAPIVRSTVSTPQTPTSALRRLDSNRPTVSAGAR